jgi:hypothetical protein
VSDHNPEAQAEISMEKQMEAIADLPRARQQRIVNAVQALIAQAQAANWGGWFLSAFAQCE